MATTRFSYAFAYGGWLLFALRSLFSSPSFANIPNPSQNPSLLAAVPPPSNRLIGGPLNVPFYLYDEPEMLMRTDLAGHCQKWGNMDPDVAFVQGLENHPRRTQDYMKARIFVLPIPVTSSFLCKRNSSNGNDHNERMVIALRKLAQHPAWTSTNGQGHVWMMFDFRLMRWADSHWKLIPDDPARLSWADHKKILSSMTVMTYENWYTQPPTCAKLDRRFRGYCSPDYFNWLPWEQWSCSVVVPYLTDESLSTHTFDHVPIESFEKWSERPTLLFYRNSKKRKYHWEGTEIRQKAFDLSGLEGVDVGGAVSKEDYARGMLNSKFCLVPRGDTPSTHKLFDAITNTCIPVIVSDQWRLVGRPFPTMIVWDAFTVQISEASFMKNPAHAIAALAALPLSQVQFLFESLQRVRPALDWRVPGSRTAEIALATATELCPLRGPKTKSAHDTDSPFVGNLRQSLHAELYSS